MSTTSSAIFCVRRVDRLNSDPITNFGCLPVAIGQGANVYRGIRSLDGMIVKDSSNATSILTSTENAVKTAANESKFLKGAGKAVNFASSHINPLICVAGGIKVLTSEDKASTAIEEGSGLGVMFLGEGLFKKNKQAIEKGLKLDKATELFDKTFLKETAKTAENSAKTAKNLKWLPKINKVALHGKFGGILSGILFAMTSITSYMIGNKTGKALTSSIKNKAEEKETVRQQIAKYEAYLANAQNMNKTQTSELEIKA
jgi:hypothetical protein